MNEKERDLYQVLGQILVANSEIENSVSFLGNVLANRSNRDIGRLLIKSIGATSRKIDVVKKLIELELPNIWVQDVEFIKQFLGGLTMKDWLEDTKTLASDTKTLMSKRNALVHAEWNIFVNHAGVEFDYSAQKLKGLKVEELDVDMDTLNDFLEELWKVSTRWLDTIVAIALMIGKSGNEKSLKA